MKANRRARTNHIYQARSGYRVRIWRDGRAVEKFFGIARYGGDQEAAAAAVAFRDEQIEALFSGKAPRAHRNPLIYPRQGGYLVSISRDGKQYTKFFSGSVYDGEQGALAAAVAWRDEMLATLPKTKRVVARERRAERLERLEAEAFLRHRVEGLLTEAEIEYLQQKHRDKADQAVSDARNAVSGVLQRYGINRAS